MNYISKQDGKSFKTKEDLIAHLLNSYSMEVQESNYKDLIDNISLQASLVEVLSVEKFKDKGVELSVLYKNKNGGSLTSEDIIIGEVDYYDAYDVMKCADETELIEYLNSYYVKYDEIEKMLINKFSVESCELKSIYTGDYNNTAQLYIEFYINDVKYEVRYDFEDSIEQFYNQVNSRFVKAIEGIVENYWDSTSHNEVFRLDGVELKDFLKNGKNVKIEILN